ncbi:MAG TPA: phasin family protein [Dehalococcoidia bacterium]|nr:phasin family protein [Dehalococcoidia bacterium]
MATNQNENAKDQVSRAAEAVRDAGREGVRAASESTQRVADQVVQLFGFSGERGEELSRQSTQNIQAVTQTSTVLARGFQEVSQEGLRVLQEQLQRNVDGLNALLRCRSVQDVVAAQSEFVRNSLEQTVEGTRRLAEVSTRVANEASQTLSEHARRGARPRAA